jgi:YD repeat-containing protein
MECPNCHLEVPAQSQRCPHCGSPNAAYKSWVAKNSSWLIALGIVVVLALDTYGVYRIWHGLRARGSNGSSGTAGTPGFPPREHPVEHGNVVQPGELRGHGKLYFVPVGRQAIPVQSLADYYQQKFGIQVTVLPAVEVAPADCIPERKQCVAEELVAEMTKTYGDVARNPESVMIALTDEDIFSRELGWNFTYSYHSARIGIVSSRRMNPAFWGEPSSETVMLASTKQMLTKYVAMQYFHLLKSYDPTSILYTPFTPNGGADDIFESDLHAEESANGLRGTPYACLYFSYSYQTHKINLDEPFLSECRFDNPATSTDMELFETNLGSGQVIERTIDLRIDSSPGIELKRGYSSGFQSSKSLALGWGANHSYDKWLSSDGLSNLSYLEINREDGIPEEFERLGGGRGFNPNAVYESHDLETYGARLTYEGGVYQLRYRDGAGGTFLPCIHSGEHCYWKSYHDARGRTLEFKRGAQQELQQITAADQQGLTFISDDQQRTTQIKASNGQKISYEYDSAGCLAKVHRADGQITLYQYDAAHHLTSMAVMRKAGARPQTVLQNEYDNKGRITRESLAGIGDYEIQYIRIQGKAAWQVRLTTPDHQTWNINILDSENYVARTGAVKFAALR